MKNLKLMQKKRDEAHARANAVATAVGENLMNEEQKAEFNAAIQERKDYDAQIAAFREMQEDDRTTENVAKGFDAQVGTNNAEKKPFENLGENLKAIKAYAKTGGRAADPRLFATATGQNETIDAEGGFLIAPEIAAGLIQRTVDAGVITSRCTHRPCQSPRLILNGIEDSNRVGGPAGAGLITYRAAEAGLINLSTLKFRRVELNMNKLVGAYKATDEVLEDAGALQAEIDDLFPTSFAWRMDNEVLNGTGQGQFLGINFSGALVVTPKVTGQGTGTFTTQNALDMRARLWVKSRIKAAWFVGPDIEEQLFTLTIPGAAGTNVALYTPPGVNGNNSTYGMLLNMPVIVVEQTATTGTQGDVILGDFNEYIIAERGGLKTASSIHVQFLTDEQVFRWTLRNDGQPRWDKPVTQNNSANKVSPFVTLAARP